MTGRPAPSPREPWLGRSPPGIHTALLELGGGIRLHYECDLFPAGLRLRLFTNQGHRFRGTLRLRPPVAVRVVERAPSVGRRFAPWAMDVLHASFRPPLRGGMGYLGDDQDLLARALGFGLEVAAQLPEDALSIDEMARLPLLLAEDLRAAAARRDERHWRVARRFHPMARLRVYGYLAADRGGRVRQLAALWPGVLVLACDLEARGGEAREAGRALLDGVLLGRSTHRLLVPALEALLASETMIATSLAGEPDSSPGRPDEPGIAPAERPAVEKMRVLVRLAGPWVSPFDLGGHPPPHFAPEDIPAAPRANARWYAAMRVVTDTWQGRQVPAGAWAFASRNAARLAEVAAADRPEEAARVRSRGQHLARMAAQMGEARGEWPSRAMPYGRWLEQLRDWQRSQDAVLSPARTLGRFLEAVRGLDLGEVVSVEPLGDGLGWDPTGGPRFPALEGEAPAQENVELRAIRTAVELAQEGRRMSNCLATRCGELVGGGRWILAGRVGGVRVNVEVARAGGRYVVEQALGVRNRRLTAEQMRVVRGWVAGLGFPRRNSAR